MLGRTVRVDLPNVLVLGAAAAFFTGFFFLYAPRILKMVPLLYSLTPPARVWFTVLAIVLHVGVSE